MTGSRRNSEGGRVADAGTVMDAFLQLLAKKFDSQNKCSANCTSNDSNSGTLGCSGLADSSSTRIGSSRCFLSSLDLAADAACLQLLPSHEKIIGCIKSLQANLYITAVQQEKTFYLLTDEGKKYAQIGSPEYRLLQWMVQHSCENTKEVKFELAKEAFGKEMEIALSNAIKRRWLAFDKATKCLQLVERPESSAGAFFKKTAASPMKTTANKESLITSSIPPTAKTTDSAIFHTEAQTTAATLSSAKMSGCLSQGDDGSSSSSRREVAVTDEVRALLLAIAAHQPHTHTSSTQHPLNEDQIKAKGVQKTREQLLAEGLTRRKSVEETATQRLKKKSLEESSHITKQQQPQSGMAEALQTSETSQLQSPQLSKQQSKQLLKHSRKPLACSGRAQVETEQTKGAKIGAEMTAEVCKEEGKEEGKKAEEELFVEKSRKDSSRKEEEKEEETWEETWAGRSSLGKEGGDEAQGPVELRRSSCRNGGGAAAVGGGVGEAAEGGSLRGRCGSGAESWIASPSAAKERKHAGTVRRGSDDAAQLTAETKDTHNAARLSEEKHQKRKDTTTAAAAVVDNTAAAKPVEVAALATAEALRTEEEEEEEEEGLRRLYEDIQKIQSSPSPEKILLELRRRKLVETKKIKYLVLEKGPRFAATLKKPLTDLTAELLISGAWQDAEFKEYNFFASGKRISRGSIHPLMRVMRQFKDVLTRMGFEEMATNQYVESSFWCFDSLFMPQQHPARDLQDTFFLSDPASSDIKKMPEDYVQRVKEVHERGGYGSIGHQCDWSLEESMKNVLRTHTTAMSSRILYKLAQDYKETGVFRPRKFFSIDRVFRNETLDATHLAEFHQVEGLIADRNLTIGHLMGVMQTFYREIGIEQLRFKPAYNPYTEPSMEIFGYHKGLKRWIEVGNSGIFRPEMLLPMEFPDDVTVIAWGLSLERPAMIRYGITNIRELFGYRALLTAV